MDKDSQANQGAGTAAGILPTEPETAASYYAMSAQENYARSAQEKMYQAELAKRVSASNRMTNPQRWELEERLRKLQLETQRISELLAAWSPEIEHINRVSELLKQLGYPG